MMKRTKKAKSKQKAEPELEFAHSRAGLSTHKKNTAEQQRLEDKLRSLDSMRRRSVQIHQDEQRSILQRLAASNQGIRTQPSYYSSKVCDADYSLPSPGDCSTSPRPGGGRRGSLPHRDAAIGSTSRRGESGSELISGVRALSPIRSARRPSVILQDLSTQPVIDVSSTDSARSPRDSENDTIIDMIAASNRPRRGRRASVGGAAVAVGAGGAGDGSERVRGERRGMEEVEEEKGPRPGLMLPQRRRRASLDVGMTCLSLLSPRSPGSGSCSPSDRRSSLASSQGTPSTPSTPDTKSRDSTVFSFPPVQPLLTSSPPPRQAQPTTPSSPGRQPYSIRRHLLRRHSSDSLIQTSPASRQIYVTPATPSRCRHKRNISLKLPKMHGRRKNPSVNRMVLLHNVLQNSSSFKVADVEEGQL